jgi:putative DNA primase/helicase
VQIGTSADDVTKPFSEHIARVLGGLIGSSNVAGPTLNSFGGEFGLAPLIGKPLAVISDARFSGKDSSIVVERPLSISGEDTLTINRKYRDQWTGKLSTRLHVLSNELPKLGDASTAIVGRIILLPLQNSWLGREDLTLEPGLHGELTGILNWALAGLKRLVKNKNIFTRVPSADEAIMAMRDLASPVGAFVREECVVGHKYEEALTSCMPPTSAGPRSTGTRGKRSTPLAAICVLPCLRCR